MRKIPPAEWFLSQDIGSDRAAAIMGDLEELAATRGRLWFWYAYLRALISLGWRTGGSAFILALVCLRLMFGTVVPWLMAHRTPQLMDAGLFGESSPQARMLCWNLSLLTAQFLCFAMPFVLIRFGPRDRLTRLAVALSLVALPVFSFRPWLMDLSGVVTLLIFAAALAAPLWRRPVAILAGTCFIATSVKLTYFILQLSLAREIFMRRLYNMPAAWVPFCDGVTFAIAAFVCIRLHRRLLEPPHPPGVPRKGRPTLGCGVPGRAQIAGGTDA
jgi:hypothetical protein